MKTVYLIGDSIFGKLKQDDLTRLDNLLEATVVNCAYGGASSDDAVRRYQWCADIKNETFVLCIGHNDTYKRTPVEEFEKNINQLLAIFKDSRIYVLLPPPVDTIHHHEKGKEFNKRADRYSKIILRIVADHESATPVNLLCEFQELLNSGTDYHVDDGVHMNSIGYDVICEGLRNAVRT